MNMKQVEFSELKGKVITEISVGEYEEWGNYAEAIHSNAIMFRTADHKSYLMVHEQECCEDVTIDDICGDLNDIIGEEILVAEENQSKENPNEDQDYVFDSFTWTFYHIATFHGDVTIKWFGTSNGYYSEDALLYEIDYNVDFPFVVLKKYCGKEVKMSTEEKTENVIDDKKIEEAATSNAYLQQDYFHSQAFDALEQGFVDGVYWFIESIWHEASEEPNSDKVILFECEDNGRLVYRTTALRKESSWSNYKVIGLTRWLYIDDLLKGGEG